MSTLVEHRKSVRVIAFDARNVHHIKTVNIVASAPAGTRQSIKECLQVTAAQAAVQHQPTYMDGSSSPKGLPTIFISGYTAPN